MKWYQPRRYNAPISIRKLKVGFNTFISWFIQRTSNRQVKLRVTFQNFLTRFSAKPNIDSKNLLPSDDRIYIPNEKNHPLTSYKNIV